jgi:hypothetical protein
VSRALIQIRFVGFWVRFFEQQLNAVGGPCRHARAKEVCIFGPDRSSQRQRRSEHGPVFFIALLHTLPRRSFKPAVHIGINTADQSHQLIEHDYDNFRVDASLQKYSRKMLPSLGKGGVWGEEPGTGEVLCEDLPNTPAENGANQNVRVEYHHFKLRTFDDGVLP